jgi:hypothetical protein
MRLILLPHNLDRQLIFTKRLRIRYTLVVYQRKSILQTREVMMKEGTIVRFFALLQAHGLVPLHHSFSHLP